MAGKNKVSFKVSNFLIEKKRVMAGIIICLTLIFAFFASTLKLDNSGFVYDQIDSADYKKYLEFKNNFGEDQIVFVAIENQTPLSHPLIQSALDQTVQILKNEDDIKSVYSVKDLDNIQLKQFLGLKQIWQPDSLKKLKIVLPGVNGLVSSDLYVLGLAIEFKQKDQNGFIFKKRLQEIQSTIRQTFPDSSKCHFAGYPVLKAAFERYNVTNAVTFILLGLLIGTLAAFYIFKSLKVSMIVMTSCAVATIWTAGLINITGMQITILSGISVCFIIIVATTTAMHIVSKYYELIQQTNQRILALRQTLDIVLRPCFMCALTTSAGFASLVISPIQMIQDAGLMISIGVLNAFFTALIICVTSLSIISEPPAGVYKKIETDLMSRFLKTGLSHGLKFPGRALWTGGLMLLLLLVGVGLLEKSTSPLFTIVSRTTEAEQISFIQETFKTGYPVSVVIEPQAGDTFPNQFWDKLFKLEKNIQQLDSIQRIDSISTFIYYMVQRVPFGKVSGWEMADKLSKREETQTLANTFINESRTKVRLLLHVSATHPPILSQIRETIQKETKQMFGNDVSVSLQGLLSLQEKQKRKILSAQIKSLILALCLITVLMMIQLRSITLGLISLIPNVFPMLTMFGLMGLLKIPVDPFVIFAAIISFGLSVDDSIHFLTQLKREISVQNKEVGINQLLASSYHVTSRALLSTTVVLFLSSLCFLFSSFVHIFTTGLLIAAASASALYADLVLLVALIGKSRMLQQILLRKRRHA